MTAHTKYMLVSANGLRVNSIVNNFACAIASRFVKTGKWVYEVELFSSGVCQLGWATKKMTATPDTSMRTGVGDDIHSWAVDLNRKQIWHGGQCKKYGEKARKWRKGSIVQCWVDCDAKTMGFGLDALDLGVAYTNIDIGDGIAPAISLSSYEADFRFTASPSTEKLIHDGFKPYSECVESNE